MHNRKLHVKSVLAFFAAAPLLWLSPAISAHPSYPQDNRPAQNSDITREELARFDRFLDNHREISEDLRRQPQLVDDREYLERHPELRTFLQDHPAIREEIKENPNDFMRREERFDRHEDARERERGDIDRDRGRREELATFDRFLDRHHEVSEQLRRDPSLVRNQQFLENHPALQSFLQEHPRLNEDLQRNPDVFMHQEERFDRREDRRNDNDDRVRNDFDRDDARNRVDNRQDNDNRQDRDHDADRRDFDRRDFDRRDNDRRGELARFDQFLDNHREISEQLRRNPSLVNDKKFVETHPALQSFLQEHQGIRQELNENPSAFMRQEERFDNHGQPGQGVRDRDFDDRHDARVDAHEDARNRNDNDRRDNDLRQGTRDRDITHGQIASFDQFLDKHRETAEQLRRDPSLVNNKQFVDSHPALQAFLQQHQGVREEITENPNAFMQAENRFDARENGMGRDMRGEQASFGQFLGGHASIAGQISKNPSLLKNQEYMASHPELQNYLKAHPAAQSELTKNPDSFIKSAQQSNSSTATASGTTAGTAKTTTKTPTTTTKTTTTDTPKPPKP